MNSSEAEDPQRAGWQAGAGRDGALATAGLGSWCWSAASDVLSLDPGLQTNQAGYGLVEINDATLLIHHQYAVFNRVEQRFEKAAFARESLDDRLQAFGIQPPDAAKHFV